MTPRMSALCSHAQRRHQHGSDMDLAVLCCDTHMVLEKFGVPTTTHLWPAHPPLAGVWLDTIKGLR